MSQQKMMTNANVNIGNVYYLSSVAGLIDLRVLYAILKNDVSETTCRSMFLDLPLQRDCLYVADEQRQGRQHHGHQDGEGREQIGTWIEKGDRLKALRPERPKPTELK
jgi:hypothetical protein